MDGSVCVFVCVWGQLINTSAGINAYKPPDSIQDIDLSPSLALSLYHTAQTGNMMRKLATRAYLTSTRGDILSFSECVYVCVRALGSDGQAVMSIRRMLPITHLRRQSKQAFKLPLTASNS